MIRAPENHYVKAWTTRFALGSGDVVSVGCGIDADDGYVGDYTDGDVTPYEDIVYAPGVLAAEFETDRQNNGQGFEVIYTAVRKC